MRLFIRNTFVTLTVLACNPMQLELGGVESGIQGEDSGLIEPIETGDPIPEPLDEDNDGYTTESDCNDNDASIHPGAEEICDGVDNNCSQTVDEGFVDLDKDGLANCVDPEVWKHDFSEGDLVGWRVVDLGGGNSPNWNTENGFAYEKSNASHSLLVGPLLDELETWTFSTEAYIGGSSTDFLGLVFNFADSDNFWLARVDDPTGHYGRYHPPGQAEFLECTNGNCQVVASDSSFDFTLDYNTIVDLSVRLDGQKITLSWDGTNVLSHTAKFSADTAGHIGFYTLDNDGGSYYGSPMVTNP